MAEGPQPKRKREEEEKNGGDAPQGAAAAAFALSDLRVRRVLRESARDKTVFLHAEVAGGGGAGAAAAIFRAEGAAPPPAAPAYPGPAGARPASPAWPCPKRAELAAGELIAILSCWCDLVLLDSSAPFVLGS